MRVHTLMGIAAAAFLLLSNTAAFAQGAAWDCGKVPGSVTAQLNGGTLVVSGSGAMVDYDWGDVIPWSDPQYYVSSILIQDGVTSISDRAFAGLNNLKSISIPNSIVSIGAEAFLECNSLEMINVASGNPAYSSIDGILYNKGVTELIKCPAKKSGAITIPSSVTHIKSWAFYNCADLTSMIIPNGVTTIGGFAFYRCVNLKSVTIPGSVVTISDEAFTSCVNLVSVTNQRAIPQSINSNVFEGIILDKVELQVPELSAPAYQSADVWQSFKRKQSLAKSAVPVSVPNNNNGFIEPAQAVATTVIPPVKISASGFTVGPNPTTINGGIINIYRQGKKIDNSVLTVYDVLGNAIRKIQITDKRAADASNRAVGSWDLKDAKGRYVSEGTYLIRGVIKTSDGKGESVSLIVGVK